MSKIISKEEYANYIDQIEQMIQNGSYKYQVVKELDISIEDINNIIEGLNDKTSSYYNVERYQKLLEKIRENFIGSLRKNEKFASPSFSSSKLTMIRMVLSGEFDLMRIARMRHKSVLFCLLELSNVKHEDYYEEVQNFLKPYGFDYASNQKKNTKQFSDYPRKTRQEFLLLALTYRISFKTMAKLLNTTVIDITNGFLSSMDMNDITLDALFMETINESSEEQEQTYQKAKQYLHKRNAYIQKLNQYSKENKEEKVSALKEMIQELHHEIDDYHLNETLKKASYTYTEEDKEIIARSILKYYISLNDATVRFHRHFSNLQDDMQTLAQKDEVFAKKYEVYKEYYQQKSALVLQYEGKSR